METEVVVALVGGGFGLAGTIGGTLLGMFVNSKSAVRTAVQLADVERLKHAQSRIWDARKDAYTDIVGQYNEIERTVQKIRDELNDPEVDPRFYLESEHSNNDSVELWNKVKSLREIITNRVLFVSGEFYQLFEVWFKEFTSYREDFEAFECNVIQLAAMQKYRPLIVRMATDELAANPTVVD